MGILLTPSDTATQPVFSTISAFADGTWIALSEQTGSIHYHTSPDGAAWSDRGALSGVTAALSAVIHVDTAVVSGSSYLTLWVTGPGVYPGATFISYLFPWSSGVLGSPTSTNWSPGTSLGHIQNGLGCLAAMVWDAGNSLFHVVTFNNSYVVIAAVDNTASVHQYGSAYLPLYLTTPLTAIDIGVSGSTVFVTMSDPYRGAITLLPMVYLSGVYSSNAASLETVAAGTGFHRLAVGNDGKPVICYADGGSALQYTRRSGTLTYSTPSPLGALSPTQPQFSLAHDPVTDDLWALFTSSAAEANGEIVARRRVSGIWQSAITVDGGDAAGYQWPKLSPKAVSTAFGALWLKGTSSPRSLYFENLAPAGAPNTPTNLTTGSVAGLTPTRHADYSDTAINDPQQYFQDQTYDSLGTTLIDDTGQTASSSPDQVYGGAALSYDTDYQWRRRYWDTFSASGAGTASPWSAMATFTPRRAGVVDGLGVRNAGVLSTTDITGLSITVDFTWTHPDGHAAADYQLILVLPDGTTVICESGVRALSLASGASTTSSAWILSGISNGASVKLIVAVTDAVSGLVTRSAPLSLTVSFAGPSAPTGFTAIPKRSLGIVALAWINPAGAVSVDVEYKRSSDSAWTLYSSGTLVSAIDIPVSTTLLFDFGVRAVDSSGVPSAYATQTGIVLDMQAGKFGIWLIDQDADLRAAIGAVDDFSVLEFANQEDEKGFVPQGRSVWVSSFGPTDFDEGTGFKVFLPGATPDGSGGTIRGVETKDALRAMKHHRLLYTDAAGRQLFVKLSAFKAYPMSAGHWWASFTLRQTDSPADAIL